MRDATPHFASQAEAWVVRLRWVATLYVTVIVNFITPYRGHLLWFNLLLASAVAYNLLLGWLLRRGWWHPLLPWITSSLDVVYAAVGCALTGGLESDIRSLFFLSPITVSLRFNLTVSMCFAAFDSIACMALALPNGFAPHELRHAVVFSLWIMYVGFAVGLMANMIVRSRDRLEAEVRARTEELALRSAELKEANEHLKALDRLKTEFVNTVSHELRTPLTSIRGFSEFLEDEIGGPLSADQHAFVAQIQEGSIRLQQIVDDLLDFARLEAGTFRLVLREVDLSVQIREALSSLQPQAKAAALLLEAELPDAPLRVHLDPHRIAQVLINLLNNAVKFTPPGGRIAVRVAREGAGYRVEVRDSGIGIAPENLVHLFQKFYQVEPSLTREFGGAGLGLSISKVLVEAHGGRIGVESAPGEGSTFWFSLPAKTNAPESSGASNPG